jgi:hypothetical protein
MSWIPACVLCLVGECLHPVQESKDGICRGRAAVTLLSGNALCEGCASGSIAIELALRMEEEQRNDSSADPEAEDTDQGAAADNEVSPGVRVEIVKRGTDNPLWRIDPSNPGAS